MLDLICSHLCTPMKTRTLKKNRINVMTLGCSKDIFDSEVLMGQLRVKVNIPRPSNSLNSPCPRAIGS